MTINLSQPVLVVDDFTTMTRIICGLLRQIGFQNIDSVHSGGDALARLRAGAYAIVIADWNMEPMSGYDLLREIRSDQRLADIRFIMISADAPGDRAVAAKGATANGYLQKPFNAKTLQTTIEEAFGKQK